MIELLLLCLLQSSIGGEAPAVRGIEIADQVKAFRAHRGDFYFAATEGILRYDAGGALLNRLGKKGQGPGEFQDFTLFGFAGDRLWVSDGAKIALFEPDGTFVSETRNPTGAPCQAAVSADAFVAVDRQFRQNGPQDKAWVQRVVLCDPKKNAKIELRTGVLPVTPGFDFEAVEPLVQARFDERFRRIYVSDPAGGGIDVFDEKGSRLSRLELGDLPAIDVDEAFKAEFYETIFRDPRFRNPQMVEMMKKSIHVPKVHPLFHSFDVTADGALLVRTLRRNGDRRVWYRVSPDGKKRAVDVLEDKSIDVTAAERFFACDGDVLWQLSATDEGDYVLRSRKISER